MCKLKQKIMQADYRKLFKRWLILLICVGLLGVVSLILLQPQFHEMAAAMEMMREGHHFLEHINISAPSMAAKISMGFTWVLGFWMVISFCILVAAWLYKAATQSGMNGLLWGVLGLGGNLFVVVVFLVVRSYTRKKCHACGRWQKDAGFCMACGAQMTRTCPECGAECGMEDMYCTKCGKALKNDKE